MAWSRYMLDDAVTNAYNRDPARWDALSPEQVCALSAAKRFRTREIGAERLGITVDALRQLVDSALEVLGVDRSRRPPYAYWWPGKEYPKWCKCEKCHLSHRGIPVP